MTTRPLLSVIVPTRNRFAYARHCITNILSSPSDDLECVIYDNSDDARLEEHVASLGDRRIRYRHVTKRDTLSGVFEGAFNLSTGRYITFIGDDDGVLPHATDVVQWMEEHQIDSLTTPLLVSYGWPDFEVKLGFGFHRGEVVVRHFTSKATVVDVEAELHQAAEASFQDFQRLSKVYYGIVRRDACERAQAKAGALFFGASPDISGCVAVASYVSKHVLFDFPIFIGGSSGASAAGRSGKGRHYGDLREEVHTRAFADTWPAEVPPFFSEETVWAHAALLTLEQHHRDDVLSRFDATRLHAKSLAMSPWKFKRQIFGSFRDNVLTKSGKPAYDATRCASYAVHDFTRKMLVYGYRASRAGYLWRYRKWFKNVNDVAQAADLVTRHLVEHQLDARRLLASSHV